MLIKYKQFLENYKVKMANTKGERAAILYKHLEYDFAIPRNAAIEMAESLKVNEEDIYTNFITIYPPDSIFAQLAPITEEGLTLLKRYEEYKR